MSEEEIDKASDRILPIVCALLASGHYTQFLDDERQVPDAITVDCGDNWKKEYATREMPRAILDAIDLDGFLRLQIRKFGDI